MIVNVGKCKDASGERRSRSIKRPFPKSQGVCAFFLLVLCCFGKQRFLAFP